MLILSLLGLADVAADALPVLGDLLCRLLARLVLAQLPFRLQQLVDAECQQEATQNGQKGLLVSVHRAKLRDRPTDRHQPRPVGVFLPRRLAVLFPALAWRLLCPTMNPTTTNIRRFLLALVLALAVRYRVWRSSVGSGSRSRRSGARNR